MLTTTEVDTNLPEIAKSPVLQAAIDGLDVTLHEELERYRHWCASGKSLSAWQGCSVYRATYHEPAPKFDHNSDALSGTAQALETGSEPMPTAADQGIPETASSALLAIATPAKDQAEAEEEDILQEWASDYRQQMATPLDVQNNPHKEGTEVQTELETAPPQPTSADPASVSSESSPAPSAEEEDFSIGIAGIVSLVLIFLSGSAIALLLFDPFGWLRSKPPAPTPTSPSSLNSPEPSASPLIDPSLLPSLPSAKNRPQPATVNTPTPAAIASPQLVAVTVPVIPAPAPARATEPPKPQKEPNPSPKPESKPTNSSPSSPEPMVSANTPELPQVKYTDPITGEEAPVPVATMTIPPAPAEGGNFVVVTDSSYKAYVQPLVQPIERPNGKIQLGAYGDPNTAEQKAEEWRRYGVPAVVVPR
jgi:hypothetical protein